MALGPASWRGAECGKLSQPVGPGSPPEYPLFGKQQFCWKLGEIQGRQRKCGTTVWRKEKAAPWQSRLLVSLGYTKSLLVPVEKEDSRRSTSTRIS